MGSPRGAWTEECQPDTALRNLTTHPLQPGLAMAAPRPPPAISVSVSAPAFYAPQKKFAPVVAPKPKVNPFRPGDSEPPVAGGAQRAQMGRVGEIPPPALEGMRLVLGAPILLGRQVGGGRWFGGIWGCLEGLLRRGLGAGLLPCPEQMFLPHLGAPGWEPGPLGLFQVSRLGVGGGNVGQESSPLDLISEV